MALLRHHRNRQVDSLSLSFIVEEPLCVQAPIKAIVLMYKTALRADGEWGLIYRRRLSPA
jgi:hypothetical protein